MHEATQTYPAEVPSRQLLAAVAFSLVLTGAWIIWHGYFGIWHDAQLYTFQALAHLRPGLLANDLFLRFGSQDDYTLFSPLYATTIRLVGVEPAAALLTLVFQVSFVAAAWGLARQLLPARLVWLAMGLLITTRGDYGTYHIFTYMEDFVTPRMAAEALVLTALIAMNSRSYIWMWICLVCAILLHPLLGAAGFAFVLCVLVAFPHTKLASAVCAAGACVLIGVALSPLGANLRFDPSWLELVQRKGYLFVSEWEPREWGRVAIPLATLGIGTLVLEPSRARTLGAAALLVGVLGIALTVLGADILQLVPVTQSQPWRFLWISSVIAVLLSPVVVGNCWKSGATGRVAALLLIAVWLLRGYVYALEIAPLAVAAAYAAITKPAAPATAGRWMVGGAWLIVTLAVVWVLANIWLNAKNLAPATDLAGLVAHARAWGREGSIPALVLAGLWWLCWKKLSQTGLSVAAAAAAAAVLVLVPLAAAERTKVFYTPQVYAAYASWRRLIPPGKEVFWAKGDPFPAWVLLERPSYMTVQQTGTNLFSRRAGLELERRAEVLRKAFNLDKDSPNVPPTLTTLCAKSDLQFLVTSYDLRAPALSEAPAGAPEEFRGLRLFRCDR